MVEEDFPELREFLADQQSRHKKIIIGLILGGILSIVAGFVIFALAPKGESPSMGGGAVAVMLVGVGAVMMIRGIISAVTDIDLRDRNEFPNLATGDSTRVAEAEQVLSQSEPSLSEQASSANTPGASTPS